MSLFGKSIYNRLFRQSLMTSCLFMAGDVLAQKGFEERELRSLDLIRTARLGLYGGYQVIFAPMADAWFKYLQRNVVTSNRSTTVVTRVVMDQFLFAPLGLSVFFAATSLMEGKDPLRKVQDSLIPAYKINLMVWPWVQFVNFTLIPLHYRLLFVNTVNIGWSGALSSMSSSSPGTGIPATA